MLEYKLTNMIARQSTPKLVGVVNEHKANNCNVVALHGWQDNSASFYPLINLLPQYNWLAFDFPGHGHSQWRHNEAHYYFVDYIDDIYQVIVNNFEQPVHIVGHSMGAMATTLFCACFPELVHSAVLIEGVGLVTTPDEEVVSQLRGAILNRNSLNISVQKSKYYKNLNTLVKARMSVSDLDYCHCESLMQRNSENTESGIKLRIDPKLKHHSGFRFNEAQAMMVSKQVNVPVKLIIGSQGFKQVRNAVDRYSHYYSKLTVNEIIGGHHCHMQNPIETAKIISEFIK